MTKLNVGLIGAGWMGKTHSFCYKAQRQIFGPDPFVPILHTICESNDNLAIKVQKEFGFENYSSNWKDLVKNPEIDIIDINTPNYLHYEIAKLAIEEGKHIYCEKPLTNSYKTALELANLAEQKGIKTLVGFNYIQNPAHFLARNIIDEDKLGNIHHFRGEMIADFLADPNLPHSWRNEIQKAGSGIIGDTASHVFSFFKHLTNKRIDEVYCHLNIYITERPKANEDNSLWSKNTNKEKILIKNETDDKSITLFKFENNGLGIIETSRVSNGNKNDIKYTITGDKGAIRYSNEKINEIQFYDNNDILELRGFKKIEMGPFNEKFANFHPVAGLGIGYHDYKILEVREFIEAIANKREAYPNFRWASDIQLIIDAAIKSSIEKRWVKLEELKK